MGSLISCSNCWYNALQAGSIGYRVGYCVDKRVILRRPDETTCKCLLRKDLMLESVLLENKLHSEQFGPENQLKRVMDNFPANDEVYQTTNIDLMNGDRVANIVSEYGEYDTKIESLSQLRQIQGSRAELAMHCLGRSYTDRCVVRGGGWKSGLHLFWWTRMKLEHEPMPNVTIDDLRYQLPVPIKRQIELVQWFILMLRLIFISDIACHARKEGDRIARLSNLAEEAAADTGIVSPRKLTNWIKKEGIRKIDKVLPHKRYKEIAQDLHQDSDIGGV